MNNINVVPPIPLVNGVRDSVAKNIYTMLKNGRRYFGSAGASLTHLQSNPDKETEFKAKLINLGLYGERDTSSHVRKWMKNVPNAVLLDSCHIKGAGDSEDGDSDHLLVIGNTVIVIDTKRWRSRKKYSINDKGTVLRGGRNFSGGKVHAKQAKFLWKKYLHKSANVVSIVCINSEKVFVQYDANWKKSQYRLVTIEKLNETLDHFYEKLPKNDKETINSTIISQIAVTCIKPYDSYERIFNMESLENFK